MHERWRKPANVLDIRQAEDTGIWTPGGRVFGEVELVLDAETIERMRLGQMCAKCQEPFEYAWPERCHVCGVNVRRDQAAYFAREFGGIEKAPSRLSLDEEMELMHELAEKEGEVS